MAKSVLSRYLDTQTLNRIAGEHIEPAGLVIGNLAGAHKSPRSGFAVEFAGHREYVPGDDTKHIDWRVYYRHDRYFIKQYELETNFVCHLLLDVSASMRYGQGPQQKLNYAARLATTLGHAVVGQSDKVSLGTFDDKVLGFIPPSNSMGQIVRMTEHLDTIEPVHKTRMAACLVEMGSRMARREIVFIFSDLFTELDELEMALHRLRYARHEVVLFHILHDDELNFQFEGMTKFLGLEDPDEILTQPEELREAYLDALDRYMTRLEDICQRNRVEHVVVNTRRNMAEVLAGYLSERKRLRHVR